MEIDFFSDAQRMDFFKDLVDEGYEDQLVMAHDIHKKIQLVSENVSQIDSRLKGPYADRILIPQGSTGSSTFFDIKWKPIFF